MTVTLAELTTELQQRLGDTGATLWSAEEIQDYITEGYGLLTQTTGCLWATDVAPDFPLAFNYTATFEEDHFVGGDVQSWLAQFTAEFERDYIDNATGPANHNFRWEFEDGHVTDQGLVTEISALVDLPEDLHEIERSTWNTRRIAASRTRQFEMDDSRYELSKGEVEAYMQDKDGLRRLRKWRVPSAAYDPYDTDELLGVFDYTSSFEEDYFTSVSGLAQFTNSADAPFSTTGDVGPVDHNYAWEHLFGYASTPANTLLGILVQIADVDPDTPQGEWGDFVQIASHELAGVDPFGVIVGIYTEPNNLRMEYRRRGQPLSDDQDFEIPDRYTVYVRHYAQARCLEREGDGQDVELAAHYQSRFDTGIARMLQRQKAMHFQRKFVLGGAPGINRRLPLARMPWQYGKVVR